jgi:phosphatidylserine decarboxylase
MNNSTPFAREGYPFIASSAGMTLLLTLFITYFFRNPERTTPEDENAVVAPADGKVIVVERVPQSPLGVEALKISIFMSVFNVHVNRVPLSGKVLAITYNKGSFFDARDGRASCENECNCVILETKDGVKIAFVQIAGLIARRIICYPKVGDFLTRGARYGLIRFGSRLDVYLPADVVPLVKLGDLTAAGETVLGRIK